jgi:hypothetical protein
MSVYPLNAGGAINYFRERSYPTVSCVALRTHCGYLTHEPYVFRYNCIRFFARSGRPGRPRPSFRVGAATRPNPLSKLGFVRSDRWH